MIHRPWYSCAFHPITISRRPILFPVTNTVYSQSVCSMSPSSSDNNPNSSPTPTEFVILGSGVSTGIPKISCIIRPEEGKTCVVCHDALNTPNSRNRRCNVSALVRTGGKTLLIDCGKTIREASMRHFPSLDVRSVDAIALSHGHADAVLGLDDARDIQESTKPTKLPDGTFKWNTSIPIPVFLNEETMAVCRNVFPYLMPPDKTTKPDVARRVSSIDWQPYNEDKYFQPFRPIPDVPIQLTPIPMYHGGDYICMGFVISLKEQEDSKEMIIAYLSDLNDVPTRTMRFLKALKTIDLLVVDVLTNSERNTAHFSRRQAIDFALSLRPKETVAVGMTCSLGLHDEVNESLAKLQSDGLSFRLSYDGERFPCAE